MDNIISHSVDTTTKIAEVKDLLYYSLYSEYKKNLTSMDALFLFGQVALFSNRFGVSFKTMFAFFIFLILWELIWTGLALWKAAQSKSKWWFIVMLLLNDLGILEILYYFYFSKKQGKVDNIQ